MTTHAWLGFILTAGAVLEVPTGLALLLAPAVVAELLLRAPLDATGLAIARLAGGGLLAVGIAALLPKASSPVRVITPDRRPCRAAATATLEGDPPRYFPTDVTSSRSTPMSFG